MSVGCLRVQPENVPFALCLGAACCKNPRAQFTRTRHPPRRHGLDRTLGPLGRQRGQLGHRGRPHERVALLGPADLRVEPALNDQIRDGFGAPLAIDDDRDPSAGSRGSHLSGGRQQSTQVGHRGWQRLGREKGQLVHIVDSRTSTPNLDEYDVRVEAPALPPPPLPVPRIRLIPLHARAQLDRERGMRCIDWPHRVVGDADQTARTPVAWGPLVPWPTSNSTRWFSSRVRKPLP